jgi:tetratricopeptide (TPR) repeat protein
MNMVCTNFRIKVWLFVGLFLSLYANSFAQAQDLNAAIKLSLSERYEDANDVYNELLKTQPNNGDVYFNYGENILKSYLADPYSSTLSSVTAKAKDMFEKGLKADSTNKLNAIGLGMIVLQLTNDTVAADKYFVKAEQMLPKNKKKYTDKHYQLLIKLATAQLYAKEPRYKKAIAYLEKGKEFAPNNPDIVNAMGDVYMDKGDASNAISNYNRALFLNPTSPVYQVKIGIIYMGARNLNEARSFFEKAKAIDSTYAPLYKGLGSMWNMASQYKLSKVNYKRFLELSGNNIPAKISYANSLFRSKDFTETLNVVEEILTIDKSRNYLNRLAAYSAYDKKPGEYEKSLTYSELFFKNTTPDQIITKDYLYNGNAQLRLHKDTNQIDNGLRNLLKAYQMDTTDLELLSNIANYAYSYRRYAFASEVLEKKITKGKGAPVDYVNLGKVYYQTKQYGKADSTFTKLTKIDSTNIQAYVWLANTYASMDPDSKLGLAKPKYEKVIQKASTDTVKNAKELYDAYGYLGSYFLLTKPDLDHAAVYYQKIAALDPNNKQWVIRGNSSLGVIYTRKKEYQKAIDYYNKALKVDPNNKDLLSTIDGIKKAMAAPKKP